MTNRNIIIGVILVLAIILIYNVLKKKPENKDDKSDSNQTNYSPSQVTENVVTSPTSASVQAGSNPQIGKTAYAFGPNTPVFNDASLQSIYKYAKKDEWVGVILGDISVGSVTTKLWWKTSGGKIVSKSSVYVK